MCRCCTNHIWWVTKNANGRLVVWWRFQYGCLVVWWRWKMAANDVSDDARWCRQRNVEYGATVSYIALYLCTTRYTWALSRRILSEDAHSWQWETLKWENRMLGPRHRFSNLTSCWCWFSDVLMLPYRPPVRSSHFLNNTVVNLSGQTEDQNLWCGPEWPNLCTDCGT